MWYTTDNLDESLVELISNIFNQYIENNIYTESVLTQVQNNNGAAPFLEPFSSFHSLGINQSSTNDKQEILGCYGEIIDTLDSTSIAPSLQIRSVTIEDEVRMESADQSYSFDSDTTRFKEEDCGKKFHLEEGLEYDNKKKVDTNTNKETCHMCSDEFTPNHLKKHMNSVHNKIRRWECDLCEYSSPSKSNLTAHVNGVHLNIRNYKCTICDKRFTTSTHRQRHEQSVHANN